MVEAAVPTRGDWVTNAIARGHINFEGEMHDSSDETVLKTF